MPPPSVEAPLVQGPALDESERFEPRYDARGLVTVVVVDDSDGAVLMVAHMNADALQLTLETGIAHYWSRSRASLWKKGETSGNLQRVVEIRTDCDQDAILLRVEVQGDGLTCHTGRRSCFYRVVEALDGGARLRLVETGGAGAKRTLGDAG